MTLDEIRARVRAMVAGMKHTDRESLALSLAREASGEDVQFVCCDKNLLTAYFPKMETTPATPAQPSRLERARAARKAEGEKWLLLHEDIAKLNGPKEAA